jgi:hypothetical protein
MLLFDKKEGKKNSGLRVKDVNLAFLILLVMIIIPNKK